MDELKLNILERWFYRRCGELTREVVRLLILEAESWSTGDGYWLRHDTFKVDIWIANAGYALKLLVWPIEPGMPSELRPTWFERTLIWSQVAARNEPTPEQIKCAKAANIVRRRLAA